ncbi:MAG: hypothetical protein ABJL67_12805 [Sulfitobacter sp.]
MTALAYTQAVETAPKASAATSIDTGAGVEMFVSGSAPTGADMILGEGLDLVMASAPETASETDSGDNSGLFCCSV